MKKNNAVMSICLKKRTAIYGIGKATKRIVSFIRDNSSLLGLLDVYKKSGTIYDTKIISIEEAISNGVEVIIVAARPSSCIIIAKRIGELCNENGIRLIDSEGNDLLDNTRVHYDLKNFSFRSRNDLLNMIDENDVISVDLFDTLIMRRTLFSSDIFELMEYKLNKIGKSIPIFAKKRTETEKYISQFGSPTIDKIYDLLILQNNITNITSKELSDIEFSIDLSLIVPRKEMCSIISDASKKGKKIFITSDTYYSRTQIQRILEKIDFSDYDDLILSCEFNTFKSNRLFDEVKKVSKSLDILHIGDDKISDFESAVKNQINSFHISSALNMMEYTGWLGLWDHILELSDKIKVGIMISLLFNNPFIFEDSKDNLHIDDDIDLGYLLFAPVISDYVLWLHDIVRDTKVSNIWFGARDGYLLYKLYNFYHKDKRTKYFLTSRVALIKTLFKDIEAYNNLHKENIFNISENKVYDLFSGNNSKLNKNLDANLTADNIISSSCQYRSNYEKYIDSLEIDSEEIGFVDFVAKGTIQYCISNLLDKEIIGFNFMQPEREFAKEKNLTIYSFADHEKNKLLYKNYFILEIVLTSFMPCLKEFTEEGLPIYEHEERSNDELSIIKNIHRGITDYFAYYSKLKREFDFSNTIGVSENIFELIHFFKFNSIRIDILHNDDNLYNRKTSMIDMI